MKKIILFLGLVTFLFSGTLRILNIPKHSTIIINGKNYYNNSSNLFEINLKNDSYNIKILNDYFLPIEIDDIDVEDKKTAIVSLNEEIEGEIEYPIIPVEKYYKTIKVIYYDFDDFWGSLEEVEDYCNHATCKGKMEENGKMETYKSNLYVFHKNTDKDLDVDIKVSKKGSYSSSKSLDAFENEDVEFELTPAWHRFGFSIGYGTSAKDVVLEDSRGNQKLYEAGYFSGWLIGMDYKHNLPYIGLFVDLKARYISFSATNSEDSGKILGYQGGIGVGYLFKFETIGIGVHAGILKNSLDYTADKDFEYTDEEVEPYVEINVGPLRFFASDSFFDVSIGAGF